MNTKTLEQFEKNVAREGGNVLPSQSLGLQKQLLHGTQRLTSYTSASGLTIYETEQYNANTNDWYIVGDCSESKQLQETLIANHNLQVIYGDILKQSIQVVGNTIGLIGGTK